ncbi:hypothetical protein, partial [Phocaeicola salanitronis]|uniref:hypothetical protein n=1 Tax=Phocaeicola salanitronis TaxID=376805 RepID=UPI0023F7C4A5
ITEAKMPQKLIPNHRTINSKQLLNFAQVNFANCFRGCFFDFMRRIAGYLTTKIGKTDRKQTQKNLIEYYFIGKFRQALNWITFVSVHRQYRPVSPSEILF